MLHTEKFGLEDCSRFLQIESHEESYEPQAPGLSKILCKLSTIAAVHLLDYVLPQVVK